MRRLIIALVALAPMASADTYKFGKGETDKSNPHRCGKNIENWTEQSRITFAGSATTLALADKSFGVDRVELTTSGNDKMWSYDFDTSPTHTVAVRLDPFCADINCKTMNAWYVVTLHPDAPRSSWTGSNTCFEEWSGTITSARSNP
jgi:hypothetical protein